MFCATLASTHSTARHFRRAGIATSLIFAKTWPTRSMLPVPLRLLTQVRPCKSFMAGAQRTQDDESPAPRGWRSRSRSVAPDNASCSAGCGDMVRLMLVAYGARCSAGYALWREAQRGVWVGRRALITLRGRSAGRGNTVRLIARGVERSAVTQAPHQHRRSGAETQSSARLTERFICRRTLL